MADYEVELGQITENRDARTQELFEVTVDIYVQETASGGSVSNRVDHQVTFQIDEGTATFASVTPDEDFSRLTLVAIRAAAEQLNVIQDSYEVHDPIAAVEQAEYTIV